MYDNNSIIMTELTKKYRILYSGSDMLFPLTEEGEEGVTYPAKGLEYAEFDTYAEALAFVTEHNLSYKEEEYGE